MPKNTYLWKFLDNLDDIIFVMDFATMTYKYISPSIRSRGVTPKEVYADPTVVFKMMDEDYRQSLLKKVNDNIDKGSLHFEYPLTMPNGEVKWYSSSMFLITHTREQQMFAGIIRDITEQKKTQTELRNLKLEYKDLYNRAPVGYHSLDPNGNLIRINDTELDWLGYSREELVGKHFPSKIFTEESKEVFQVNFPLLLKYGHLKDLRLDMLRKDGSILSGMVNATLILDDNGNILMTRSIVTDIGDLKLAEERLQFKQLELAEANEALNQSNMKLERLNFTKDVLLKIVSHDLRNPLATINLISALLREKYELLDAETILSYLEYINAESVHANQILSDVSEMISLETEDIHLNIGKTDLWTVIEEAIGINSRRAEEKNVHLVYSHDPTIKEIKAKVDARWLVRALDNIISNAIKFSNKGGKVRIACRKDVRKVVLSIEDSGIGMPEAMLPRLFDKFAMPSRPGTAGEIGSGLGLSIVKQILDMQVSDISVKSQEGVGSTFEIRLPMAN